MRKMKILCTLLLVTAASFFCNNLDKTTNVGSDILNQNGTNITDFGGKFFQDTVPITAAFSFVDTLGDTSTSIKSGLVRYGALTIGMLKDKQSIGYAEYNADKLYAMLREHDSLGDTVKSFYFSIKPDLSYTSLQSAILEIGFAQRKETYNKINPAVSNPVTLFDLHGPSSVYSIPLKSRLIKKDSVVFDTNAINTTQTRTTTTALIKKHLYAGKGKLYIKADTATQVDSTRSVTHYDSLASLTSLIGDKTKKMVKLFPRDSLKIKDTTIFIDSIMTLSNPPDSIVRIYASRILVKKDSLQILIDTTVYDTTTLVISKKSVIVQEARFTPKLTFKILVKDSLNNKYKKGAFDTIPSICVYAKLHVQNDTTLLFMSQFAIRIDFKKANDTMLYTDYLNPHYTDFSVFEKNPGLLQDSLLTSGAAGRYTVFELDCRKFWHNIKDSTDTAKIKYINIPKAQLAIQLNSVALHKSAKTNTSVRFLIREPVTNQIEDLSFSANFEVGITDSTRADTLNLGNYFTEILKKYQKTPALLPLKVYLFVGLPHSYFADIRWKKTSYFTMNYLFLNSQ